ncbi:hypothetical protein DFJ73DRAFT_819131 [Zopfochytrium polystomum]|nr:hypothetical protein DFJ73DRAFT_819131 [Zopfochytrium polystomum]
MQLEFDDLACLDDVDERVLLRVGVATGNAVGGLIGAKMGKYCLLGDAVEKSVQLCRTAQPGTVNVGPETQKLMDGLF